MSSNDYDSSTFGRGRGRPKKDPIAYDEKAVKEFILRYFEIEREKKVLQQDSKDLKEEFKKKIDATLIANVIKSVKAQIKLELMEVSSDTISEIEEFVKEKIAMVL